MEYDRLILNGNVVEKNKDEVETEIKLINEDIKAIEFKGSEREFIIAKFEEKKIAFYNGKIGNGSIVRAFMTFDDNDIYKVSVYFIVNNMENEECARYHLKLDNGVFKLVVVSRFGFSTRLDKTKINGSLTLESLGTILRDASVMVSEHSYYNKSYPFQVNNEMISEMARIPEIEREILARLEEIKSTSHNAITRMELEDFLNNYNGVKPVTRGLKKDEQ
ncbi:MAG: hypothetical protein NC483_04000 [Ruminococcus sp.]|nr:hypothetical protein [Ruminococcus sp.]